MGKVKNVCKCFTLEIVAIANIYLFIRLKWTGHMSSCNFIRYYVTINSISLYLFKVWYIQRTKDVDVCICFLSPWKLSSLHTFYIYYI